MWVDGLISFLAIVVQWGLIILVIPLPLSWLLVNLFYPHDLMDHYLVQPQFSRNECRVYPYYPTSLAFSGMTMWIFCFPSWGRKRKMTDIRERAPGWFKYLLSFMAVMVFMFILWIIALLTTLVIAELYPATPT